MTLLEKPLRDLDEIKARVSNRRRTQTADFESIEVCYPPDKEQQRALIANVLQAKRQQKDAGSELKDAMLAFSNIIDGRGTEEIFEIDMEGAEE